MLRAAQGERESEELTEKQRGSDDEVPHSQRPGHYRRRSPSSARTCPQGNAPEEDPPPPAVPRLLSAPRPRSAPPRLPQPARPCAHLGSQRDSTAWRRSGPCLAQPHLGALGTRRGSDDYSGGVGGPEQTRPRSGGRAVEGAGMSEAPPLAEGRPSSHAAAAMRHFVRHHVRPRRWWPCGGAR